MKINLSEIYAGLKAWRDERKITAENQKSGYIVNVMEEFGELAEALRCYERIKEHLNENREGMCGFHYHKYNSMLIDAEYEIIDAICDIAVYTINAWSYDDLKEIDTIAANWNYLLANCAEFNEAYRAKEFKNVLVTCATLCDLYGFNFEVAMLETIKEISSRMGKYDENAKKWVKDESDEAKSKWYKANFEKARL